VSVHKVQSVHKEDRVESLRGENKGLLTLHILPKEKGALAILEKQFVKKSGPAAEQVQNCITSGREDYKKGVRYDTAFAPQNTK
jgi:hypothetical protein